MSINLISQFPTDWVKKNFIQHALVKQLGSVLEDLSKNSIDQAKTYRRLQEEVQSIQHIVENFDGNLPGRGAGNLSTILEAKADFIKQQCSIVHLAGEVKKLYIMLAARLFGDDEVDTQIKADIKSNLLPLDFLVEHQTSRIEFILDIIKRLLETIQGHNPSANTLAMLATDFMENSQSVGHLAVNSQKVSADIKANYP